MSVSLNYYEVLGVTKTASQEEIRKAYKRCALRYHPDKMQSRDAAMFQKVNDAYQILRDPERRRMYDDLMTEPSPELWHLMNMLLNMMKQYIKTQDTKQHVKKYLTFDISVNLAEVYRGDIKKLTISTKKRDGTKVQKNIYISLKGIKPQYVFEGQGDEMMDGSFQDIIIKMNVVDDVLIKRDTILDTLDLNTEIPISLYEYYEGFEKDIKHLDGEVLHLFMPHKSVRNSSYTSCFNDYVLIDVLKEKGLPDEDGNRSKLYVYFRLVLPESVPLEVLKTLETTK